MNEQVMIMIVIFFNDRLRGFATDDRLLSPSTSGPVRSYDSTPRIKAKRWPLRDLRKVPEIEKTMSHQPVFGLKCLPLILWFLAILFLECFLESGTSSYVLVLG